MASAPNTIDQVTLSSVQTPRSRRENRFASLIQLWHLLSLDAPTVAMLWTWFLVRSNHLAIPMPAVLAMGLAVWMLYAADRLLDARGSLGSAYAGSRRTISLDRAERFRTSPVSSSSSLLEPRHLFHHQHQKAFRLGIFFGTIVLATLLPRLAPHAIRLYLLLGALLVGYFILIHASRANAHRLPKELAVGIFFSAAIFIPTIARSAALRPVLFPGAVLFAVVCGLNCVFIYAWEHPIPPPDAHFATRIAVRCLTWLSATAAIAGILLAAVDRLLPWTIPVACSIAVCLLFLLHCNHHRFSPTTLRGTADLCLLTPIFLLPFLH